MNSEAGMLLEQSNHRTWPHEIRGEGQLGQAGRGNVEKFCVPDDPAGSEYKGEDVVLLILFFRRNISRTKFSCHVNLLSM